MPSLGTIRRKALKVARNPSMIVRFVRERLATRLGDYRRGRVLRPHQRTLLQALEGTSAVRLDTAGPVELHILCGRANLPDALAMLKSFYLQTGKSYPLVVHEDGSFGDAERAQLAEHFPGTRIIDRARADAEIIPLLESAGLSECAELRRRHIMTLKLFDLQHYARGKRVLYVDTDILFFERPDALLEALESSDEAWRDRYNEDVRSCYAWSPEQIEAETGIRILPRVNAGMMAVRIGTPDWARYERWLRIPGRTFYSEQTLWAMHLSAAGAQPLPADYDVCFRLAWEGTDWQASLAEKRVGRKVVTEHFCGGLECRVLFYERFMQRLADPLRAGR